MLASPDSVKYVLKVRGATTAAEVVSAAALIKPKLSKSCDMRLHWLRDRVAQLQFLVRHIPGLVNIADYFTKSLPVYKHNQFAPYISSDSTTAPAPALLPTTVSP